MYVCYSCIKFAAAFSNMGRIIKRWAFGLVFLLNLFRISLCLTQDIKTWHTDTNFLNPRNWEKGQMPCANDRIIFPSSTPIITMMPDSLSIRELILPFDGVLVFPENAEVNLTTGTGNEACPGKDVHFQATTDLWYDPINWNITSDRAFPRIPNRKNAAVPHTLRVPCITDKAQFPEKTTFRSSVIYPVTKVASMVINSKSYSQSELDDLLRSHVGSLLFPGNPVIQVTNSPCTDESGCACGNDGPELEPTICNEVTPYCPKSLECSDPITPVGNCCPICGARIMIKHKESFRMDRLMALHRSFLDKGEYKDVESFTAKTFQGDIQSVFVDGAQYKGLANKVADKILNSLNSDLKDLSGDRYRIRSVEIYKSESWNSGVPTYESLTGGMSSGGLAALIVVMIVVFGLGAAFFIYKKRHISGFDFARFDLRADKIELELGTTPHDELQPVDPPESTRGKDEKNRSFDNPVYGTSVEEVPSAAGESAIEKGFVENPMFMVFEDFSGRSNKEDKKE